MTDFLPVDEQMAILDRGIVDYLSREELKARLERGRPLRIKAGFDPTAPDLHIGHTVVLHKMRQFQQLGHQAIFLIGDFTGRIGDPTGKHETRKALSVDEVMANAETYKQQVFKILDPDKTEVRFNSEWMEAMSAADMVRLASTYTIARLFERDDFRTRYKENLPISVHELLYPLVQGYDSVALEADVELGGHDQIFNLLVGRVIQREYGQPSQIVMTMPLLEGTDARVVDGELKGQKMSKSLGNYIGINDPAQEIFGKTMSISDELMWKYFELLSDRDAEAIAALKAGGPRDAKLALAAELVTRYHGAEAGDAAREQFLSVFSRGQLPDDMPVIALDAAELERPLLDLLVAARKVPSKREGRRLFQQGAVKLDQARVTDLGLKLSGGGPWVVQVGKRTFVQLTLS
jgi:tyrosyl-tRNA synthetase